MRASWNRTERQSSSYGKYSTTTATNKSKVASPTATGPDTRRTPGHRAP